MRRSVLKNSLRRQAAYLLFTFSVVFIATDINSRNLFNGILEERFNALFSNDIRFHIGTTEGGIFRDIVSNNITISHPNIDIPFKINRVEIPYRIWYPLLNKFNLIPPSKEGLKIFFGRDNPFFDGYLSFDGSSEDLAVNGYVRLFEEKRRCVLNGEILHIKDALYALGLNLNKNIGIRGLVDFDTRTASIDIRKDKEIALISGYWADGKLIINTGLRHIDFRGMDIVGEINSVIEPGDETIKFSALFKNLIINYTPFKDIEINGEYVKRGSLLNIASISVKDDKGEVVKGFAKIVLFPKKYIDLYLMVKNLLIENAILTKYDEKIASGTMNGELKMNGPIDRVRTDAHFDVQDGRIQNLEFESLIVTLKGKNNMVSVEDGWITKEEGNLIMSGEIDFALFPSSGAFEKLKIETDRNVVIWSGWEVSKRFETSKIKAQKKLAKDITFSFETHTDENLFNTKESDNKSEIGVEYKIDKNESLRMKLKDDESFIGLEHKIKF